LVTPVDGRGLVGGEDHRDTSAGELAQQAHHLRRRRRVQARGGFIQEEGARPGKQLDRDAGALALAPRQHPDRDITPIGQVQLAQYFIDHPVSLPGRCAGRQAESRRVLQRAPQRHLAVDDVVLGDVADARVRRGTGIDPNAVMHDLASRGRPQPRKNLEQGGLSRSAAAHKSNELTRLDGEGHLVEDLTPPGMLADADGVDASPDGSPDRHQRGRAGRGCGVRGVKRELCHEVLLDARPASLGHYGHRRAIGATTLGANLEKSWRRQARIHSPLRVIADGRSVTEAARILKIGRSTALRRPRRHPRPGPAPTVTDRVWSFPRKFPVSKHRR